MSDKAEMEQQAFEEINREVGAKFRESHDFRSHHVCEELIYGGAKVIFGILIGGGMFLIISLLKRYFYPSESVVEED
jgi:hypothetical protein